MISLAPQRFSDVVSNSVSRKIGIAAEKAHIAAVAAGLSEDATAEAVQTAARKTLTRLTGYEYCGVGMVKVAG